jgi:trk system potassium uptake protein TrkH
LEDPVERPLASCMTNNFLSIDGQTNVAQAVKLMQFRRAEAIIVMQRGEPAGVVTDSDILEKVVMKGEDSDQVPLREIMTAPIVALAPDAIVKDALAAMKLNKIKRVMVMSGSRVVGMVTQKALAEIIRTSVLERTFRKYRTTVRERYKPVLANLGFVMQFAGILMIAPALVGTVIDEPVPTVGMYLAVVGMFATGFLLSAYGERGPINLKEASVLVVASFVLLSLFGSIPYMFINPFWPDIDPLSLFVNSFFESVSGFTTTGMTTIALPENLPESFAFYRAYTQWIGGLSFIYLIMAIFYPEKKLRAMKSALGDSVLRYKQLIVTVVVIFSAYTALLSVILLVLGLADPIYSVALVFSAITGGGFVPDSTILSLGNMQYLFVAGAGMILSALPFAFHYSIFNKEMRLKNLGLEVVVYFALLAASSAVFTTISGINPLASVFHAVSASTNSGFQFSDIGGAPAEAKIFLIVLMLVGGTAFSTAGGIKVGRLLFVFQRLTRRSQLIESPASVSSTVGKEYDQAFDPRAKKEQDRLLRESLLVIALFPAIAVLTGLALAYLNSGSIVDGTFASTSALTTTGLQLGLVTMDSDLATKSILAANMIAGRFEIVAILYIFFSSLRKR